METKDKIIAGLGVITFILIFVIIYLLRSPENQDIIDRKQQTIDSLKKTLKPLKLKEDSLQTEIDQLSDSIQQEEVVRYETKYIYRDAKVKLFNMSDDKQFILLSDNLSKADSLRR